MAGEVTSPKRAPMAAGQRYDRLVAVEFVDRNQHRNARWRFKCDCGGTAVILANSVRRGITKSCGCLLAETAAAKGHASVVHGMSDTQIYFVWHGMINRCCNPKDKHYRDYGGRGIKVCVRWREFANFYADVGARPSPAHQLDRIDNDGNYEPGNVRWGTPKEQSRNRRSNRTIIVDGQAMTLAEASEKAGLGYATVRLRLNKGWTVEQALSTPVGVTPAGLAKPGPARDAP